MIPAGLLPPEAVHAWVAIGPSAADDEEAGIDHPRNAPPFASDRRGREFRAGRRCAAQALTGLLGRRRAGGWHVGTGADGAPVWPVHVVGSITHTANFAAAAVMPASAARGLGIDAEPVMSRSRAALVSSRIATADEIGRLQKGTLLPPGAVLTAIFSAKESLFKALFPRVRRMFDYHDARIDPIDIDSSCFHARLVTTLTPEFVEGMEIRGRIRIDAGTVFSCVHLPWRDRVALPAGD